jgi:penicillin-binding protein 1C
MLVLLLIGRLLLPLVPLPAGLADPTRTDPPIELQDRHGTSLRVVPPTNGLVARPLAEADIPKAMILATLAAEDARFYRHPGFDPLASIRAASQWIRHRRIVSGASTITQQLVKLAHPRPRTIRTKIIETVIAARLELEWDKDRILRAYLARIDYGNRCAGLTEAARHYFGKRPGELDLAECAFLAGLPQAPTRLNPRTRFDRAKARQEWILGRCVDLGWIDVQARDQAAHETIALVAARRELHAPHFVEHVLGKLVRTGPTQPLRTTLDLPLQQYCESVVRLQLATLRGRNASEAAVIVLDNASGGILAMVGSPDFNEPRHGQVNGTLARRSPGSALKPFTYLLAFVDGAHAADVIADIPCSFATPTGVFQPANYDLHCRGPVSLREALANSLNIPAVRVLEQHGGPQRLQQQLQDFGLTTLDRSAGHYGLGLTLGDAEVRLVELANAYATLARLGLWHPVTFLLDSFPASRRVAPADECWLVADILADPLARAGSFGLVTPLRMSFPVACKTGTSTAFRDNWAFGFTPEFTVGVWVGNFDSTPMTDISGVSGAAPVLREILEHLHATRGTTWFSEPNNLTRAEVEPLTGRRPPAALSGRSEVFLHGRLPEPEPPDQRSDDGRIRLPAEYRDWFASADNRIAGRTCITPTSAPEQLRIVQPQRGTLCFIDPDLPESSQRLILKATRDCHWSSDTLTLDQGRDGRMEARLVPGRHQIRAHASDGSPPADTWIEVRHR